ncbi:contractile injection system tape measure protein [Glaciimonas sp. GG7]
MSKPAHSIGKLQIEIDTPDLTSALALRARAEEIAWQRIPHIIDNVFDALAPTDLHVRIDKLTLDLGDIDAHALENALPEAFERALRSTLADAIATALHAPDAHTYARAPTLALLDAFGAYLVNGTLPMRRRDSPFAPAEIIARLMAEQPAALVALLRRHAQQRTVIERLVLQADQTALHALLGVLAPADQSFILGYLADVGRLHPMVAPAPLAESSLRRALWVLTLEYLLHEAGTQFNRRTYLATLIAGVVAAEGVSYAALLALLHDVANTSRTHQPLTGSLLGVLDALLRASHIDAAPPKSALPAYAAADAFASAEAGNFASLLALLRRTATQPLALEMLIRPMSPLLFAHLIGQLQPVHAALILAYVVDLSALHHARPQLALSADGFERQMRMLVLRYLLLDAGSQFNRLSWLRQLLQGLAASAGVTYSLLLTAFSKALDFLRERMPLSSSLPEALALLSGEVRSQTGDLATTEQGGIVPLLSAWPQSGAPTASVGSSAVAGRNPEAAVALAERFLRTGSPHDQGAHLSELAATNPGGFAALLRRLLVAGSGNTAALIERLLIWMLPDEIIATLLPGQADQAARWADMLADLPGASMASAWTQVLDAALRGDELRAPDALSWPAPRLDHLALLRHWLDTGVLPWWAMPDLRIETLLADLPGMSVAALHGLFADAQSEQIERRLQRIARYDASVVTAIITQLAPGPLAALSSGLDGAVLEALKIRIAAATIAGIPLDPGHLARPLLAPPPTPVAAPLERPGPTDERRLFDWLAGHPNDATPLSGAAFRLLADLLAHDNPTLDAALQQGLSQPDTRQRWATIMPAEVLARLLHRIAPTQARFMLDTMTVMLAAWGHTHQSGTRENAGQLLWRTLLAMLAEQPRPLPRTIAARLLASLAQSQSDAATRLLTQAHAMAKQGGYANVTGALQVMPTVKPRSAPARRPARPVISRPPDEGTTMYIANAGLVLIHPFLPQFFKQLGLLTVDDAGVARITGTEAASRAVHLLQYMVDHRCDAPEPELVLNKLLCGLTLDTPVARAITPDATEMAACRDLINAVIEHWPSIANTSRAGVRETFLEPIQNLFANEAEIMYFV